jgi:hypothetical protein
MLVIPRAKDKVVSAAYRRKPIADNFYGVIPNCQNRNE